jgi:hypothetical protein
LARHAWPTAETFGSLIALPERAMSPWYVSHWLVAGVAPELVELVVVVVDELGAEECGVPLVDWPHAASTHPVITTTATIRHLATSHHCARWSPTCVARSHQARTRSITSGRWSARGVTLSSSPGLLDGDLATVTVESCCRWSAR